MNNQNGNIYRDGQLLTTKSTYSGGKGLSVFEGTVCLFLLLFSILLIWKLTLKFRKR